MPLDTTGRAGTRRMESLADIGVEEPNPTNLSMDGVTSDASGVNVVEETQTVELGDVGINELAVIYRLDFYNGDHGSQDELNFSTGGQVEVDTSFQSPSRGNTNIGGGDAMEDDINSRAWIDGVTWNYALDPAATNSGFFSYTPANSQIQRHFNGYVYLNDEVVYAVDWSTGSMDEAGQAEFFGRIWYDTIEVEDDLLLELLRQD